MFASFTGLPSSKIGAGFKTVGAIKGLVFSAGKTQQALIDLLTIRAALQARHALLGKAATLLT